MKIKVVIDLEVPEDFEGVVPWGKIETLNSFVSHWLDEGYYVDDCGVSLPGGIEVDHWDIPAVPEIWWKEITPLENWEAGKAQLLRDGRILKGG